MLATMPTRPCCGMPFVSPNISIRALTCRRQAPSLWNRQAMAASSLAGGVKQRTRIRALEIIQNEAPSHPSVGSAAVDDGMGEFRVDVSSIRQRLLEHSLTQRACRLHRRYDARRDSQAPGSKNMAARGRPRTQSAALRAKMSGTAKANAPNAIFSAVRRRLLFATRPRSILSSRGTASRSAICFTTDLNGDGRRSKRPNRCSCARPRRESCRLSSCPCYRRAG